MDSKESRKQWKNNRGRDRRQARFLIRERVAVGCCNPEHIREPETEDSIDHDALLFILEKLNVGHRSHFSLTLLQNHVELFETPIPTNILLNNLPEKKINSRLGVPHLGRTTSYLQAMDSISLMEHAVLLGRYFILTAFVQGGISCCLRGRVSSYDSYSQSAIDRDLQVLARRVSKRFFDCFPLSLSSYIYKRVIDLRVRATMEIQEHHKECAICHRVLPKQYLLKYSKDFMGATPACGCIFCEECYWEDILKDIDERDGDVVQCPCCKSDQGKLNSISERELSVSPQQRFQESLERFQALPLDSIALRKSGRKRNKVMELESLSSHWSQAVLPSLGFCQSVRKEKLFTFTEKGALPFIKGCLEAGVDLNAVNEYSQSALFVAAWQGNPAVVRLLLVHGADPFIRANGSRLDDICAAHGHGDCLNIITEFRKADQMAEEEEPPWTPEAMNDLLFPAKQEPKLEVLIDLGKEHPGAGSYLIHKCITESQPLVDLWKRLPIDQSPKKQETCADRFYYCDAMGWLRMALKQRILEAFNNGGGEDEKLKDVIVLPFMRFLHYAHAGSSLAPHVDLHRVDTDSGLTSTHTLILYLYTCERGGETNLLGDVTGEQRNVILSSVQPMRGCLLLFPHETPHEGGVVEDPKLLVRGEVVMIR